MSVSGGCRLLEGMAARIVCVALMALAQSLPVRAAAADTDDGPRSAIDEIVVVATREARPLHSIPFSADLINRSDLRENASRSTPQAFRDISGVMVQETAFGQGSPYVRGFTGFRNLFLIDGVRLNNPVFREGPNQYWSTVDLFGLDRIEIVKGPSSTLYGSDAIGGTVNAVSADPFTSGSRVLYRYASAERSHIGRVDLAAAGERLAGRIGLTGKTFGDLQGGREIGRQDYVGYDEHDVDARVGALMAGGWRADGLVQIARQTDVPRTHRTVFARTWADTSPDSNLRWELDQNRYLSYLRVANDDLDGALRSARFTLSYQGMQEDQERIRGSGARQLQGFELHTLGLTAELGSDSPIGRLTYGAEYYDSTVNSHSSSNPVQGPVGDDSVYSAFDLYVQDQIPLASHGGLILALRHTRTGLDARSVSDPVNGERIRVQDDWNATVGSANAYFRLLDDDRLTLFGGVSQGFRAPNLSDVTRFDSARSSEFEVPAPGLDAENFLSFEGGMKWRADRSSLTVAYFHTDIDGMIIRVPTGNEVNGELEITKANIGDGWARGFELSGAWSPAQAVVLFGNVTWMDAEVDTYPTSEPLRVREPLDRLMPVMGSVGARWQPLERPFWVQGRYLFAGKADRLSTRDRGDTTRIPPGGTPGFNVLHLAAGYEVREGLQLTLAVDNLTNEDYRIHGSGTNMPGRNLVFSAQMAF